MTVGQLRERIQLQTYSSSADAVGQPVATWSNSGNPFYARVENTTGAEQAAHQQTIAVQSYKITCRNEHTIRPRDRLSWGSKTLNVVSSGYADERGLYLTV